MTKQQRKYLINIALLIAVTALALFFVLKDDPTAIFEAIAKADYRYLILAGALMLVSFAIDGLILTILARLYNRKYKYYKGFCNGMIGTFFNGITPSSSGGQFVQAFTFSKQGIKITNAASILFMQFIVHQIVIVLYGILTFAFKFSEMSAISGTFNLFGFEFNVIGLSILGFVINALVIVGLFSLAFSKKIHKLIVNSGVNLLAKMKIIKDPEQKRIDINTKVETFRIEFKRLSSNIKILLVVIALKFVQLTILYSIPFVMGMALEINMTHNLFEGISLASFVSMVTSMVPIPGASGGAELVFTVMFRQFFDGTIPTVNAVNLLWRGFTFYFGLFLGAIVFFSYHESPKQEAYRANTRTMLELEIINLAEYRKNKTNEKEVKIEPIREDQIEDHFKKLKEDLKDQLHENELAVKREDEEKKK